MVTNIPCFQGLKKYLFDIWLITITNLFSILIIHMTDQISSDLRIVEIKLNTTQLKKFYNVINMRIMPEFLTEDAQCR